MAITMEFPDKLKRCLQLNKLGNCILNVEGNEIIDRCPLYGLINEFYEKLNEEIPENSAEENYVTGDENMDKRNSQRLLNEYDVMKSFFEDGNFAFSVDASQVLDDSQIYEDKITRNSNSQMSREEGETGISLLGSRGDLGSECGRRGLEEELWYHEAYAFGRDAQDEEKYYLKERYLEESCNWEHVAEEHRNDSVFPLGGPFASAKLDEFTYPKPRWFEAEEVRSLLIFLEHPSNSTRVQALWGLKNILERGDLRPFLACPWVIRVLGELMASTDLEEIRVLCAGLIMALFKEVPLRRATMVPECYPVINVFLKVLEGKEKRFKNIMGLMAKGLAFATTDDLEYTGFLIKNFKINSLISNLQNSDEDMLRLHTLTLIKNILDHPQGYEYFILSGEFTFEPFLRAILSLVYHYHNTSLDILNRILVVTKGPYWERLHARFIRENGIQAIVTLLEDTSLLEPKLGYKALMLLDHLTDGERGVQAFICFAYNFVKSLLFYRSIDVAKRRGSRHSIHSETNLADIGHIDKLIVAGRAIDKYNAPDAPIYEREFPPEEKVSVEKPKKMKRKHLNPPDEKASERSLLPSLAEVDKRIKWRATHPNICIYGKYPEVSEFSKKVMDSSKEPLELKMDDVLKLTAARVLVKLATRDLGAKIVTDLIRNMTRQLRRHDDIPWIVETVSNSLHHLCQNNYLQLKRLLLKYDVLGGMYTSFITGVDDRPKAAILGPISQLLKQSPRMVHQFAHRRIRKHLHYWLVLASTDAPAYAGLYCTLIIHNISRHYYTRDYIMSRTVVKNFFRMLQDPRTEEIIKIYAICALANLTLANKRYKEVRGEKLAVKREDSGSSGEKEEKEEEAAEVELDECGPYPTIHSFSYLDLDDRLLDLIGTEGRERPLDFFTLYLLTVMVQRAPSLWSPLIFKYHGKLMSKILKNIEAKQPFAEKLYSAIMYMIPSLSFYHQNIVYPWSKIDTDDFYVCAADDQCGCFPFIIDDKNHQMDPRCGIYKLSKNDHLCLTPWDHYWKERYNVLDIDNRLPSPCESVFMDSLFGLGGISRKDESEPLIVYATKLDDITPLKREKYFLFHSECNGKRKADKPLNTFSKSPSSTVHKNVYCDWCKAKTLYPRQIILPNIYEYKRYLTQYKEMTPENVEDDHTISNEEYQFLKNIYLLPLSKYTNYQIEQLGHALPDLIERSKSKVADESITQEKKDALLEFIPTSFFENIEFPIFEINDTFEQPDSSKKTISPYVKVVTLIRSVILSLIEKQASLRPLLGRPGEDSPETKLVLKVEGKPLLHPDSMWVQNLSSFGKYLLSIIDSGTIEQNAANFLKYSFIKAMPTRLSRVSLHNPKGRALSTSKVKKEDDTRKKTAKIVGKGNNGSQDKNVRGSTYKNVSTTDVYLPTEKECLMDLFFQTENTSLRKPNYSPEKENHSLKFLGTPLFWKLFPLFKATVFDPEDEEEPIEDKVTDTLNDPKLAMKIQKEMDKYSIHSKLGLEYVGKKTTRVSKQEVVPDLSAYFEILSPHRNNDFSSYCEYVKEGVRNILKEVNTKQCWYANIIKFIANSVNVRLEGPFGQVDDYLMRLHRQELQRILGTSVIPFGCLKLGEELERAVLFKFLADQCMIPCGLHRENENKAWVEVPVNPFTFGEDKAVYVVNLTTSPGKLMKENTKEANEYISYYIKDTRTCFDEIFEETGRGSLTSFRDYFDYDKFISYIERVKGRRKVMSQDSEEKRETSINDTIFDESMSEEGSGQDIHSECSSPLAEKYFQESKDNEEPSLNIDVKKKTERKTKRVSIREKMEEERESEIQSLSQLMLDIREYAIKPDPVGKFTTRIKQVPEKSFVISNEEDNRSETKGLGLSSFCLHLPIFPLLRTRSNRSTRSNKSSSLKTEDLSECRETIIDISFLNEGDWEDSDYFEKWKNILKQKRFSIE